ncbi:MAG: stage II sporulation protein R [Clostridia bacterium]|nr:stage II sporulation protein R [Clostridia bacterium]
MYAKKLLTVFLSLSAIFIFIGIMPVHGENEIYDSVVRLHVLANSDSEEDQALKLKVRDSVLELTTSLVENCSSSSEAEKILAKNLDKLKEKASATIDAEGFDYSVEVTLGNEDYPTRDYGELCFPSGSYTSLRILIGDAEGQNWWCVLFPPLCMSAATKEQEDAIQVGFTGEEYKIITDTDKGSYKLRFKILEAIDDALKN